MTLLHRLGSAILIAVAVAGLAGPASAHITPPVILMSDRDALLHLLTGARRFFVREVRLSPADRQLIQNQTGWSPDEDFYRFYIGRDDNRLVAATIFLTEFTIHGPVRAAVSLGPDGRVKGVNVVELTEETYPWVKPLIDQNFARAYVGRDGHAPFTVAATGLDSMTQFYGQIIANLVRRAAVLFEVGVIKRGDAALELTRPDSAT